MLEALMCLTLAVYFEARSEPSEGQIAVAQVVLNRVASEDYPDNICEVVKERKQFSFYWDGKPETVYNKPAWGEAFLYASAVYYDLLDDLTKGATHYHADYVTPTWATAGSLTSQIDKHIFYRLE
jgi:spore germination cell wall hydrolase CwlJ-like protein